MMTMSGMMDDSSTSTCPMAQQPQPSTIKEEQTCSMTAVNNSVREEKPMSSAPASAAVSTQQPSLHQQQQQQQSLSVSHPPPPPELVAPQEHQRQQPTRHDAPIAAAAAAAVPPPLYSTTNHPLPYQPHAASYSPYNNQQNTPPPPPATTASVPYHHHSHYQQQQYPVASPPEYYGQPQQQPPYYYSPPPPPLLPPQYYQNNNNNQEENEASGSVALKATALMTVGGLVGLSAAAAYRWLNGGDFCLFPPATAMSVMTTRTTNLQQRQEQHQEQQSMTEDEFEQFKTENHQARQQERNTSTAMTNEEEEHYDSTLLEEQADDDESWNHHQQHQQQQQTSVLAQQIESLVQALKSNTEQQELLLQKVVLSSATTSQQHEETRRITDQSMNLLRSTTSHYDKDKHYNSNHHQDAALLSITIFCKLAEIHVELSSLRRDFTSYKTASGSRSSSSSSSNHEHQENGNKTMTISSTATTTKESFLQWETRLLQTMEQLESCMERLNPSTTITISNDSSQQEPQKRLLVDAARDKNATSSAFTRAIASPCLDKNNNKEPATSEWLTFDGGTGTSTSNNNNGNNGGNDYNSSNNSNDLADALQLLVKANDRKALREGAQLLYLYVMNLSSHPHVPRYRKIFTSNESFHKVNELVGGREVLMAVGFVQVGNYLEWLATATTTTTASLPKEEEKSNIDESNGKPQDGENDNKESLEEMYVLRLKEATAALSVLKAAPTEELQDTPSLVEAALQCLSCATTTVGGGANNHNGTAPRSPLPSSKQYQHVSATDNSDDDEFIGPTSIAVANSPMTLNYSRVLQTPDPNIASPPATKKQFLTTPNFPLAQLEETSPPISTTTTNTTTNDSPAAGLHGSNNNFHHHNNTDHFSPLVAVAQEQRAENGEEPVTTVQATGSKDNATAEQTNAMWK